jgi:hypothetical protein
MIGLPTAHILPSLRLTVRVILARNLQQGRESSLVPVHRETDFIRDLFPAESISILGLSISQAPFSSISARRVNVRAG